MLRAWPTLAVSLLLLPLAQGGGSGVPTFRESPSPATGVELNLGVAPDGHVFVGGWNGVYRSTDDGLSWQPTSGLPATVAADRTLRVDHATGRVFLDDTYLGCTFLQYSADEGASWIRDPVECGASVQDHEKIAVGPRPAGSPLGATSAVYPAALYVCGNGLVDDACGSSLDGGITMVPLPPHGVNCAYQGQPTVSATGVLYEASNACGAQVRFSADGGLTWTTRSVPVSLDAGSGNVPVVATTPDGALYFVYMTPQFRPAYVWSLNDGASWSAPVSLAATGVTSSVLPAVIGGAAGNVAVGYYGTTAWSGDPGAAPHTAAWNGYVAVVTGADTPTPVVQAQKVTSDPLAWGCVSKQGGCGGDPIADYMDIDVGPDGRVHAVFMDACPAASCSGFSTMSAATALVAVQTGGTDLAP